MGKSWDSDKGGRDQWIAWMTEVMCGCFRVMKPGAHGLVWALPRTSHWTATALEDAGFGVRDVVTHLFGSGFPKASALNRSKSGVFCQCALNKHSNENISREPREDGHNNRGHVLGDGVPLPSGARHSMSKPLSSRADCPLLCGSCDGCVPSATKNDQAFSQPQECAPKHNHFVSREGVKDFESSHNLSQALRNDRPSNQGLRSRESSSTIEQNDISESKRPKQRIHSDIELQESDNGHRALLSSAWDTCTTCGKPRLDGWYNGGLKPASEHWILIRKPLSEKTVAANVLKWGCGALNIDASRISGKTWQRSTPYKDNIKGGKLHAGKEQNVYECGPQTGSIQGRFPANLVLSHSPYCEDNQCDLDCAIKMLDEQSGSCPSAGRYKETTFKKDMSINGMFGVGSNKIANGRPTQYSGESGGASRFFYCAKVSPSERGDSTHPTMKSQKLMRYLIRMVTPPGGAVLDPFMGSGSTGLAAKSEGFGFVGIEQEEEYLKIAEKRVYG